MSDGNSLVFQQDPYLLKVPKRYLDAKLTDIHNNTYRSLTLNYFEKFDSFWRAGVGLGLFGPPGTGKTYTAAALALQLFTKRGKYNVPIFWVDSSIHFETLIDFKEFRSKGYFSLLNTIQETPLVVFDDISSIQHMTKIQEKFFSVIQYRYSHNLPSVFTGNFNLGKELKTWGQMDACFNSALTRRIYETLSGNFATVEY